MFYFEFVELMLFSVVERFFKIYERDYSKKIFEKYFAIVDDNPKVDCLKKRLAHVYYNFPNDDDDSAAANYNNAIGIWKKLAETDPKY